MAETFIATSIGVLVLIAILYFTCTQWFCKRISKNDGIRNILPFYIKEDRKYDLNRYQSMDTGVVPVDTKVSNNDNNINNNNNNDNDIKVLKNRWKWGSNNKEPEQRSFRSPTISSQATAKTSLLTTISENNIGRSIDASSL